MRRVSVVGGSGSGKTTTGRAIADRMGVSFVEIDALHWTHPGWELPPLEEFRASVDAATRGDAWVVEHDTVRAAPRFQIALAES